MAVKFSEVQSSPEFQSLNPGQQNAVKSRFFNNVILKDSAFGALSLQQQGQLRTRFFGQQDPNAAAIRQQIGFRPQPGIEQQQIRARDPSFTERFVDPALEAIGLEEARFGGPIENKISQKSQAFVRGVKEEGPLFIGETVGEVVGSVAGPKGRILGAGIGRASADAMVQIAQGIIDSPQAPQSSKDAALRLLKQFAIGAGTELVSETAIGTARRLGAPFVKKTAIRKPIPDIDDLRKIARTAGLDLDRFFTAAQRSASRGVDTFEEMAENAFFGRGRIRDIKEITQPAGIRKLTDQLMDFVLPRAKRVGRGELGDILNDVILGREKTFKKTGQALYKRLDDLAGGTTVDLRGIRRLALKLQEQRAKAGGTRKAIDEVIDDILARPEFTDFQTAHIIRSEFLDRIRNLPSKKTREFGVLKQAASNVDRKMQDSARRIGPDALSAWRTADRFWKTGKKEFNSQVVKRVTRTIANETPDKIVEAVFARKSPTQIKQIMKFADPLTQQRLRFAFLEDLMDKSSRQIPGDISDLRTLIGGTFIENFDKLGDETLDAAFGPELKKRIRNIARIAKTTQGKTGGAGGFLIQLIQAGPIAGAAGGVVTGQPELAKRGLISAIPLAGFTESMSFIIATPRLSKLLTDVMQMKPGTRAFTSAAARLSRSIFTEKRKANKRKLQSQQEEVRELRKTTPGF